MFLLTKNKPRSRVIRVGAFRRPGSGTTRPESNCSGLRGALEFRTVVASFSKQSRDSIVAHADAVWKVDYSGEVTVDKAVGEWRKTGAKVIKVQGWQPIRSSSGVEELTRKHVDGNLPRHVRQTLPPTEETHTQALKARGISRDRIDELWQMHGSSDFNRRSSR